MRFGQREGNGARERREGGSGRSTAIIISGSTVVTKDERREEIADAGEVTRDKWYTGGVDYR